MFSHQFLSKSYRAVALAIAPLLLSPLAALANPLEIVEGWVYTSTSSPVFGVDQHGLPEGVVDRGGFVLGDATVEEPYLISLYDYNGEMVVSFEQLLLQRQLDRDGMVVNEQLRELLDSAVVSQPKEALIECQINGEMDPEIVAIASATGDVDIDQEWITDFQGVWRANRTTKELEPIASENVRCYNMGFGYDG
ncbi:hypothetical protein [[Limnothrix rosea] IAM M-220]|uniref:hypothetical protein n=1 Tax=[Limnothrix rosea] IAM M-220 TaxID=454133 RepID=UPI00095FDBC4|nr:hypothetical protein [[Limnothrix rosea] IAM M-220]OKH18108.1 hypothetical protein NIES208_07130 [[Limnothrix rosea] IAM M-220]